MRTEIFYRPGIGRWFYRDITGKLELCTEFILRMTRRRIEPKTVKVSVTQRKPRSKGWKEIYVDSDWYLVSEGRSTCISVMSSQTNTLQDVGINPFKPFWIRVVAA